MAKDYRGETGGKLHAVGKMLQRGGAYDTFRLTDSEVPWLFLNGGKVGREAADRFLAVAGPDAQAALDDAFSFSLRRAAQRENGTLDLAKYQKWIDGHADALSARPELLDRFDSAAKAQQRLNEVTTNLAEHDAAHPLKPGWGASDILRQFWKPGPQGAETMQRFLEITGGRPEAVQAAADYAALDFASRPGIVRNGEVVPRAAEAWVTQHEGALSKIPGLRDKFANAAEAQKTVDQAIAQHLDARDEFTKSVAGSFIQDDPERAVARIFSGGDRVQKAKTLMDVVGGNQAAREGLQRAAIDHILSKFSGAPIAGAEGAALKPQMLQNFIAENRGVLDVLFPDGLARNFDAVAEDLRRSQMVANARMPGGSDTAELANRIGLGGPEHGSNIGTIAAAVLGEHIGQHIVGGLLGGPVGLVAAPIGMRWLGIQRAAVEKAANRIVDQMLLDPQYAVDMLRLHTANTPAARVSILNRLGQRIAQTTIQAARADNLQSSKPNGKYARGGAVVTTAAGLHQESKNVATEPTEAQKEAGNYRKAHVIVQGLPITIENAKGSFRRGVGPDGKPWAVRMRVPYGYLKKTTGMDGEHVDVYVGPRLMSERVYIIDQVHADTKAPDEHKVMIGFPNRGVALANYRKAFSDGRGGDRIGEVTEMTIAEFKNWLKAGDTKQPLAA